MVKKTKINGTAAPEIGMAWGACEGMGFTAEDKSWSVGDYNGVRATEAEKRLRQFDKSVRGKMKYRFEGAMYDMAHVLKKFEDGQNTAREVLRVAREDGQKSVAERLREAGMEDYAAPAMKVVLMAWTWRRSRVDRLEWEGYYKDRAAAGGRAIREDMGFDKWSRVFLKEAEMESMPNT